MRTIEVVYSPLCEATGSMLGKLRHWLEGTDIQINVFPFDSCPQRLKSKFKKSENCFIEVFYDGDRIDSVPLHRDILYAALDIPLPLEQEAAAEESPGSTLSRNELMEALSSGELTFLPITRSSYREEMSMCLCNYPFGNPPKQFHKACLEIKDRVFSELWALEDVAGIYARYKGTVVGLLEVMPREILKKYGFMTGTVGMDSSYLSVACYEACYGITRVDMLELRMKQLIMLFPKFHREYIEGVGIYGWDDGFNPYWVYEKYDFAESEKLSEDTVVMVRKIER
ncbi:MAG: hypothetical protein IJY96_08980 [Oscillospiraceae bacterium]|nr:hypothetical protein [Oscillospiraceae bacterium]